MGRVETFPGVPPAAASRLAAKLLNKHSAHEIAEAIEVLVDVLDLLGGDPDRELSGDEQDSDGDERGDQAWIEWHTMPWARKRGPNMLAGQEDDEDDDPAEANGDEKDTANAEDEMIAGAALQFTQRGPGCPFSDPGERDDGH